MQSCPCSATRPWACAPPPARPALHRLRRAAGPTPPASAAAAAGSEQQVTVAIPGSKDEAVADAVQAAAAQLRPLVQGGKVSKGFSKKGSAQQTCFCVELPTASDTSTDVAELAWGVAAGVAAKLGTQCTVVCADPGAAAAFGPLAARSKGLGAALALREACRKEQLAGGGVLVVVGAKVADVALCEQLVREVWPGPATLLVNAEFAGPAGAALGPELQPFLQSLAVVWCFQPVQIKGLLGNMEGAVLKRVVRGAPDQTPYQILKQVKGEWVQIGQSKKRPDSDDLQVTFINASASKSPLTAVGRGIRGLSQGIAGVFQKDKGKQ